MFVGSAGGVVQPTNIFLSSTPLPAPQVFYGRDDFVDRAISLLKDIGVTHIAILGPGGIGKTTVALIILHHPDIRNMFGDRRYFVPCDAATSPELLVHCILQVLGIQLQGSSDPLTSLHVCLSGAGPLLLVLDNFETPWHESEEQTAVESILQRIADVESVSLIITMRGIQSPSGIQWTQPQTLPPLSKLDMDSARLTFVELAGNKDLSPEMDALLQELDCVPLAIKLIAQLAKTQECGALLDQ